MTILSILAAIFVAAGVIAVVLYFSFRLTERKSTKELANSSAEGAPLNYDHGMTGGSDGGGD